MREYLDPIQPRSELLDAFQHSECAVCAIGRRSVERYLGVLNYASIDDSGIRRDFRDAGGFCNVHAYQWLSQAYVPRIASFYQDLLETLADSVGGQRYRPRSFATRFRMFIDGMRTDVTSGHLERPCPACVWLAETESMLLITLVAALDDPGFRSAYLASPGLCVPHLRRAMQIAHREDIDTMLQNHAEATFASLDSQLAELIQAEGCRYQHESPDEEAGVVARAVAYAIGFPGRTTKGKH